MKIDCFLDVDGVVNAEVPSKDWGDWEHNHL